MTAVRRRWAGLGGPCCFIGDGVELSQEIQGISCLVVEGLANMQGESLTRIDDVLDTSPLHCLLQFYVIKGVSRACGTLNAVTVASQRWPDSSK